IVRPVLPETACPTIWCTLLTASSDASTTYAPASSPRCTSPMHDAVPRFHQSSLLPCNTFRCRATMRPTIPDCVIAVCSIRVTHLPSVWVCRSTPWFWFDRMSISPPLSRSTVTPNRRRSSMRRLRVVRLLCRRPLHEGDLRPYRTCGPGGRRSFRYRAGHGHCVRAAECRGAGARYRRGGTGLARGTANSHGRGGHFRFRAGEPGYRALEQQVRANRRGGPDQCRAKTGTH